MFIYDDIKKMPQTPYLVATIGIFDGVHLGHQYVINYLKEEAKKKHGQTLLITFDPHPKVLFNPLTHNLELLQTLAEKKIKLASCGIDHLLILPFTHALAQQTAYDFVEKILINSLHINQLVVGYDHHFGKNREGNMEFLQQIAPKLGFSVAEIPAQTVDSTTISSTKIRQVLQKGDIQLATSLLGSYYCLTGKVVSGKQLGRTMGYPTANIELFDSLKLVPCDGIYIVKVQLADQSQQIGILSIGTNPTIATTNKRTIEVFLLDYNADLYDQELSVFLIHFLRKSEKFSSLDELVQQMKQDEYNTRNYMATNRDILLPL